MIIASVEALTRMLLNDENKEEKERREHQGKFAQIRS